MKRFQFSLENILSLRKHEEREWELKLAAASGECSRLRLAIRDALRDKNIVLETAEGGDDTYALQTRSLYIRRLDFQMFQWRKLLEEKERIRLKIQKDYLEASRKRKVLDRLREKRSNEYTREMRKKETKVLDDLSSSAAARKLILLKEEVES
jgi:flagellar FliJ protein